MTTSTLSRFIDGAVSTSLGKLSIVSISFISFIVTTRWLAINDLGVFVLLKVIVAFLIQLSSLGVDGVITKFLAGTDDGVRKKTIINTIISFRIFTIVFTSLLAFLVKDLLFSLFGTSVYYEILIFIPILLAINSISSLYNGIFAGLFNFRMIGFLDFINSLSGFIAIMVLVVWQDGGVMGRVYAFLFQSSVTLLIVLIFGRVRYQPQVDFQVLKEILEFGFPIYLNYYLSFAFLRADTLIIGIFLGPAQIAYYEIAKTIPDSLNIFYEAFNQVYFPTISKIFAAKDFFRVSKFLSFSIRFLAFSGFFAALCIFLYGSDIIILLFDQRYLSSVNAFAILMVVWTFLMIETTYGYSLIAIGDPSKPPLINIIHTAINFLGYWLLITPFGITGLAIANMLGSIFCIPLNIFFLRKRQIDVKINNILIPVAIFIISLSVYFKISPQNIFLKLLFFVGYLILGIILKIFSKEELLKVGNEIKGILIKSIKR